MRHYSVIMQFCYVLLIGCQNGSEESNSAAANESLGITDSKQAATQIEPDALRSSFSLKHDFGIHDEGEEVFASVNLKNDTDRPVRFRIGKASCGCVKIKALPSEILPGDTGAFEFSVDTKRLIGKRLFTITAWDSEPPTVFASIESAIIVKSVETKPSVISIGNVSDHVDVQKNIFVTVAGHPDAEILSVDTDASWLSLEIQSASTGNDLKRQGVRAIGCCKVKWTGQGAIPGPLSGKIYVKVMLDDKQLKTLSIPVNGQMTGALGCSPSQLIFPIAGDNAAIERKCLLTFNTSEPDIVGVTCVSTHESVMAEVKKKSNSANQWELKAIARFPSDSTVGISSGKIVGSDANGKVIFNIPYSAYLVRQKEK